jgi:hypothetical protein
VSRSLLLYDTRIHLRFGIHHAGSTRVPLDGVAPGSRRRRAAFCGTGVVLATRVPLDRAAPCSRCRRAAFCGTGVVLASRALLSASCWRAPARRTRYGTVLASVITAAHTEIIRVIPGCLGHPGRQRVILVWLG